MNLVAVLAAAVGVLSITGCATSSTEALAPRYLPSFDFTPPSTAAPASADVAFAIVNASYAEVSAWSTEEPFTDFSRKLSQDFQECLVAKGFTVRGPYATHMEMTYPDKRNSDLVIEPALEVTFEAFDLTSRKKIVLFGEDYYAVSGKFAIGGRVSLTVSESLSNERMWVKSIEIPRTVGEFQGEGRYASAGTVSSVVYSDRGLQNAVARALEGQYARILQTAWDYLDPEEMALVKTQSQEVRSRWIRE